MFIPWGSCVQFRGDILWCLCCCNHLQLWGGAVFYMAQIWPIDWRRCCPGSYTDGRNIKGSWDNTR